LDQNAVSYSTCKKWFQQFRERNFNFQDSEPALVNQKKMEDEELEQILNENFCQTQLELANELGVSQ